MILIDGSTFRQVVLHTHCARNTIVFGWHFTIYSKCGISTLCLMGIICTRCTINNTCVSYGKLPGVITSSYLNSNKVLFVRWSIDCFVMRRLRGRVVDSFGNTYLIFIMVFSWQTNSPTSNVIRFRKEKERTPDTTNFITFRLSNHIFTSSRSQCSQTYILKQTWQTIHDNAREFPLFIFINDRRLSANPCGTLPCPTGNLIWNIYRSDRRDPNYEFKMLLPTFA
jgi:hypothetical protein